MEKKITKECEAGMRIHGGHVWEVNKAWINHHITLPSKKMSDGLDYANSSRIWSEVLLECLDCGVKYWVCYESKPIEDMVKDEQLSYEDYEITNEVYS